MNKESEIASPAWVGFALLNSEANRKSPSMSNPVIAYEKECAITQEDVKVAYNIADKMGIVDMDKIKSNHPEYAYLYDWVVFLKMFDANHVARAKSSSRWSPLDVYFNQQYEANGHQVINALVATIGHVAEELQKPCDVKTEHINYKSSFFDTDRHILVNFMYAFCFIPAFFMDAYLMFYSVEIGEVVGMLLIAIGVVALIPSCIVTCMGVRHVWEAVKKIAEFVFKPCKRIIMWMDDVRII